MGNILPKPQSPLAALRVARVSMIADQAPTLALTLCWNDVRSRERARFDVRGLFARVERRLFGKKFHLRSAEKRIWFFGALENLQANAHAHLAVRVPEGHTHDFTAIILAYPSLWNHLAVRGSIDLQPIESVRCWAAYSTKDLTASSDDWFLSDEFRPQHLPAG